MNRAKKASVFLSFALSVGLLGFFASTVDFNQVKAEFAKLNYWYTPLLFALLYIAFWIRAIRWKYLLPSTNNLSTQKLFNATIIGMLANFILPLRAGEVIRPWLLKRSEPVSFSAGFASIITERMFDVVTVLIFLAFCLGKIDSTPKEVVIAAQVLGVFSVLVILFMLLAYLKTQALTEFCNRLFHFLFGRIRPTLAKRLSSMTQEFVYGFRAISTFKELLLVIFWSIVLWLVVAVFYQVGLWAFDRYPSWWVGIAVNVMVALAIAVPSSPGFIGTYQLGCSLALEGMFSMSRDFAFSYSVVLHLLQAVFFFGLGIFILHRQRLSLSDLRHASEAA